MTKLGIAQDQYEIDWTDLAFASKKQINSLKAVFIAAPRRISPRRFGQLIKEYLPNGNIVLGIAKENYVLGFEGQSHFSTLQKSDVQTIINKVNLASPKNKVYILHYFQREANYILQKLAFKQVLFINGSWQFAFHTRDLYYTLTRRNCPFELVPAFSDETEARDYENTMARKLENELPSVPKGKLCNEYLMMKTALTASKHSYDYNFQTGAALGKSSKKPGEYIFMASSHNRVVPYETYAMLNGASRETNLSPPHDLNHYDTVHAEVEILIKALANKLDLSGGTLFINLLPCPPCSRMLCTTDISEIVYMADHSQGYAVRILELAGKKVRRLVLPDVVTT